LKINSTLDRAAFDARLRYEHNPRTEYFHAWPPPDSLASELTAIHAALTTAF
jgi:hypothetical protein